MLESVDKNSDYLKLSDDQKETLEISFGLAKIISAIMSNRCQDCNALTSGFDVLTCSRACLKCWKCLDANKNGQQTLYPPSIPYANDHYMVSEKEIRKFGMAIIEINLGSKYDKIVSTRNVEKLGEDKFGGSNELAEEKTKRASKSEENWLARCEKVRLEAESKIITRAHKSSADGITLPQKPPSVRFEEQKANPKWKNKCCVAQKETFEPAKFGYVEQLRGVNYVRQSDGDEMIVCQ